MADHTPEDPQAAYDSAMAGSEQPTMGTMYCPECDREFLLSSRGDGDELCEHLLALLKERS